MNSNDSFPGQVQRCVDHAVVLRDAGLYPLTMDQEALLHVAGVLHVSEQENATWRQLAVGVVPERLTAEQFAFSQRDDAAAERAECARIAAPRYDLLAPEINAERARIETAILSRGSADHA